MIFEAFTFAKIQLANWRWSWPSMLITGICVPVLISLGLAVYARRTGSIHYAVVSGLSFSLLFELQGKIAANMAFMRASNSFEQFAATGGRKVSFLFGSIIAFTILVIPAILVTPFVLIFALDLKLDVRPVLILALLFSILLFLMVGVVIGCCSRSIEQSSSVSTLVSIALMSIGPVAIPGQFLPAWLRCIGHANPAVHIARLFRVGLFSESEPITLAIVYLSALTFVFTALAVRVIPWRKL